MMSVNILTELKSKLSNFIFDNNDDTLNVLVEFIIKSILLRSKNRSIYFDDDTIFLIYGHTNPQVFLERLYFDGSNLCIDVKENNRNRYVEKVLFKCMDKTNIIAVCLKLLNKEMYDKQDCCLAKKNAFDAKIGAENALNRFSVALENFLITKFKLNEKHTFVFDEDNQPKIWVDLSDKKWVSLKSIKRTRYGVELVTTNGVAHLLSSLNYECWSDIYNTFK